jgi:hypothetical protein
MARSNVDRVRLNKEQTILKLQEWFPDWQANQIWETIISHKGSIKARRTLAEKALKQLLDFQRTLLIMKRDHPESFEKIDQKIRLQRLVSLGYKTNRDESIEDSLKLTEISIELYLNSLKKSNIVNGFEVIDDSVHYYATNNNSKNYHLIRELEVYWNSTKQPKIKSDESKFCKYLSICLFGNEEDSELARAQYQRTKDEGDEWGQKR